MSQLLLLTARDCHLCEHAKDVLSALEVQWREVDADSREGRELSVTAPPLRPVLYGPSGRIIAYGRLSARRLAKQLQREEVKR